MEWKEHLYVLPFPMALMALREASDVDRDPTVEGLLQAADAVEPSNRKVLSRYTRTAQIWLRDGGGLEDDNS